MGKNSVIGSKAVQPSRWNLGSLGPRSVLPIPTILIAHHDDYSRKLIETTLDGEGFAIACVSDGIEALAAIRSHTPDLLVIARDLAELDGPTVVRAMCSTQDRDRTKVIMLGASRNSLDDDLHRRVHVAVGLPFRPIALLVAATDLLAPRPVSELARDSRAHLRIVN